MSRSGGRPRGERGEVGSQHDEIPHRTERGEKSSETERTRRLWRQAFPFFMLGLGFVLM